MLLLWWILFNDTAMKQRTVFVLIFSFCSILLFSQSWFTVGGNNAKNGRSRMPGPTSAATPLWSLNADLYTAWGNAVYISGDRFVQTRIQLDPVYTGQVECRQLSDGALLWTYGENGGIPYVVGFNEHAVYVHDYATADFLALDPQTGAERWRHPEALDMFGGNAGIVFACNGDPVVFGKRIDQYTGETVWATTYLIPILPDGGYAVYGDTYYHWEGTVLTPKRLIAIDMNSGQVKYKSDPMPGDPDQENPLTIGPDGVIYISRDGGPLIAYKDNGAGFDTLWMSNFSAQSRVSVGPDGSLYYFRNNRLLRVDPANGQPLDTSVQALASTSPPLIAIDPDGRVYASNGAFGGAGRYYCYTPDLSQILWTLPTPTNYYSGPAFGRNGVLIAVGEGTSIRAYSYAEQYRPVADFEASTYSTSVGSPVVFQDYTSFSPLSFEWHFPGGAPASSTDQNPPAVVYDAPGWYDVTLIVQNALGTDTLTKACLIEVKEASSASEPGDSGVRIYPNPASDWVQVEAPEGSWVRVWEAGSGRLLLTSNAAALINVGAWPAGMYVVEVKNGKGVWRRRLVVSHSF